MLYIIGKGPREEVFCVERVRGCVWVFYSIDSEVEINIAVLSKYFIAFCIQALIRMWELSRSRFEFCCSLSSQYRSLATTSTLVKSKKRRR